MFPIFVAFLLQQSMAFCSSFGYRYYSTRCWLVRHQMLTTNRWNKILRIHSGYVWFVKRCRLPILRFFPRQRPQKKSRASLHPFVTALSHISASALPEPASEQYSYITLDIGDYHHQFLKISHKKGLAKAFQPCSNEYGMVWVKHF